MVTPVAPSFVTALPSSFSVYRNEPTTFNLPVVDIGTHPHDSPITVVSTSSAAFTATWSVNAATPFVLSYDGTHDTAHTGSLTITLTNSKLLTNTYTVPYSVIDPVAPSFVSNPVDFRVVIGFDETYTFPSITDGSHTPSVLTVSINTISASDYTFDASAKTFKVHSSNKSVFDSLAGTTLTLTSILSHNYHA